ncbi:helix-turn-helix domain-containing protein [Streptomyces sp. NPDC102467]|uniref:PucR family transcriptional regulator n=1 Tax=Streptomyces sp. NPDC102467 TaxID=3366179 RepID=UPI003814E0F0
MPETAAAPRIPPTPPVPLATLLAREDLGLRLIGGGPAEDVVIYWVHTSEMPDPYPYLLGGELLLSAGAHATEAAGTGPYFDDYVARIVAAGGAALGFGLAPVHDTVPRALVEACERRGLPLLEVPPRTTFSGVARAVWSLMAQVRHAELRRVTQAQQSLAAAAARPDPVAAVLGQLARFAGGFAVLADADGVPIRQAGREPADGVARALTALIDVVRGPSTGGRPTSASDTVGGTRLSAYALSGGGGHALGLTGPSRDSGDHTVAGAAVVLLSLLTSRHQLAGASGDTDRSAALVRLLLGARPEDVAELLGGAQWRVAQLRWTGAGAAGGTPPPPAVPTPLVDVDGGRVRALLPADQEITGHPGWAAGVSAPAGLRDLAAADAQASRALARARATRSPLVHHRTASPGLALTPLLDNAALLETLRIWLSLHGSWDRTAAALGVHRNTVRQRVTKCATLLTADLDDPDVRMELWFALRYVP